MSNPHHGGHVTCPFQIVWLHALLFEQNLDIAEILMTNLDQVTSLGHVRHPIAPSPIASVMVGFTLEEYVPGQKLVFSFL